MGAGHARLVDLAFIILGPSLHTPQPAKLAHMRDHQPSSLSGAVSRLVLQGLPNVVLFDEKTNADAIVAW